MLVITSDHGEEFSEHGGMGHGTSLYAEQINTFFILWDPGRLPAKRIPRKVRTIDFFPTILALAGIKPEASKIDGLNLGPLIRGGVFPESNNIPVISELGDKKAVFLEGWKYIFDIFLKTDELFNEAEDKGDSINLADRENRRRDKMRQYLAANCDERTPDRKAVPALAEEMKKEIRSLGYVGGTAEVGPTIGYRDLNSAVTDRIDAGGKAFNPLQFEFGWYGRETAAGSPYFCVGPHVRLFLKKANRTQAELVIEGKVDLEKLGRKAQHIRLSSEGRLLGEAVITETGPFTMSAKVPPDMGKDRPLELVILCDGYYREKGANGANILISLDVSTIHFR
jgi:hypothetical protein